MSLYERVLGSSFGQAGEAGAGKAKGRGKDLAGQTGLTYVLNTANALPGGTSYVVCTSSPSCGFPTVSNEITVFKGDVTGPVVTTPGALTTTQTLCQ